jgi:vitamin B12 transporter
MFRLSGACALALTALSFSVSTASAQTTALPETVISANQVPQPADRVGASVTVLQGEQLRAQGIETVADALRTVPGVHVQTSGSKGSITQIRIRGGDANHVLVQIDGIPTNRLDAGDFDFADFLVDDIDRIEVIRGPQSGIYGGNAHTGVISIFTKSGRGLKKPEVTFRMEGGTQRSHWLSGTVAHHTGPFYGALSFQHRETDGFSISPLGPEKDGHRVFIFNGKAGIDLSEHLNIEGVLRHVDRKAQLDPENNIPLPDGFGVDTFEQTNARLNATLTSLGGTLVQRFGVFGTDLKYSNFNALFGPPPFMTAGQTRGGDYKASLQYSTGAISNTSTFVLDYIDERFQTSFGDDAQRNRFGTAYEHIFDLPTGTSISGAMRQDFNDKFADYFTWRVAISQRLPHGTRIHSAIGKGVTLPNFNEMFSTSPSFIANPNLQPESSIGWDVGVEQTLWNGRLVFDVTYFNSRFENRIARVAVPGGVSAANIAGISPRHGVEITGKLNPWSWLTLEATYTFTDAQTPADIPEVRRPKNAATFVATYRAPDNKTRASIVVTHNGKMRDEYFPPPFFATTSTFLAGYTLVNAIVSYQVNPNTQFYIRGENLLNEKYEEIFSYRSPGATGYVGLRVKLGDVTPAIPYQ